MTKTQREKLAAMPDKELREAMDKAECLKHWRIFWRYYFEIAVRSMK